MSFETGTNSWRSFWSGPPSPKRKTPIQIAIQLSMIVEITSCAPTVALRNPAIPAQSAPQSAPAIAARTTWTSGFKPSNDEPIHTAKIAPDDVLTLATDVEETAPEGERDGKTREDERRRDDQRLLHVERGGLSLCSLNPGEEPVEAGALEDRAIGRERVLARRDENDEAADGKSEERRSARARAGRPPSPRRRSVRASTASPRGRGPDGSCGAPAGG